MRGTEKGWGQQMGGASGGDRALPGYRHCIAGLANRGAHDNSTIWPAGHELRPPHGNKGDDVLGVARPHRDSHPDHVPAQPPRGSTVLRIALGTQLRRLREARGISRETAGEAIR
ncbi:MAG: hypothetical protein ACRDTT_33020, partial [Pseudonocardiaceae bacterium]